MVKSNSVHSLFGRRLKDLRLRANIPQDKLGVMIGLEESSSSARISRYETGIHEPSFGVVVRIAKVLNVPTAYFYCEDDVLAKLIECFGKLSLTEQQDYLNKMADRY